MRDQALGTRSRSRARSGRSLSFSARAFAPSHWRLPIAPLEARKGGRAPAWATPKGSRRRLPTSAFDRGRRLMHSTRARGSEGARSPDARFRSRSYACIQRDPGARPGARRRFCFRLGARRLRPLASGRPGSAAMVRTLARLCPRNQPPRRRYTLSRSRDDPTSLLALGVRHRPSGSSVAARLELCRQSVLDPDHRLHHQMRQVVHDVDRPPPHRSVHGRGRPARTQTAGRGLRSW